MLCGWITSPCEPLHVFTKEAPRLICHTWVNLLLQVVQSWRKTCKFTTLVCKIGQWSLDRYCIQDIWWIFIVYVNHSSIEWKSIHDLLALWEVLLWFNEYSSHTFIGGKHSLNLFVIAFGVTQILTGTRKVWSKNRRTRLITVKLSGGVVV